MDYPKTGNPVPEDKIPEARLRKMPDWNAPETTALDSKRYYESQRAIGKLYRSIQLPALQSAATARSESVQDCKIERIHLTTLEDILEGFDAKPLNNDLAHVIKKHITRFILVDHHDEGLISEIWDLAEAYRLQLQTVCADHSMTYGRNAALLEAEAVIGTINAKCSQQRRRKDMISKLRERTASLVQAVEHQLAGEMGILPEASLRRAWVAYKISLLTSEQFGSQSFGWIAMREIFDSIKVIEGEQKF